MNDPTPAPPKQEQKSASSDTSGQVNLASIGMLIAPLIAALAGLALTGTIGRVQRDYPFWLSVAIGCVVLSGALWVAASVLTAPKKEARSVGDIILRVVSIFFATAGFILALGLAVSTADNEARPQIDATLSGDYSKLTTSVSASGLPSSHRLAFRIDLLQSSNLVQPLYQAYVGPETDGKVEQTITTPLPPSGYNEIGIKAYTGTTSPSCDDFKAVRENPTIGSGTGCVIVSLPSSATSDPPKKMKSSGGGD